MEVEVKQPVSYPENTDYFKDCLSTQEPFKYNDSDTWKGLYFFVKKVVYFNNKE